MSEYTGKPHFLKNIENNLILILFPAMAASIISCLVSLKLTSLLLAGGIYAVICLLHLPTGILLTLLMRSSMDIIAFSLQLGPLTIKASSLIGIWIIVLTLAAITLKRITLCNDSITVSFLIFLAVSLIPGIMLAEGLANIDDWLKMVSLACMYLLVLGLCRQDRYYKYRIINIMVLSSIIPLTVGLYQYITGKGFYLDGLMRLNSTFVHPNPFGFYLIIIIGVCLIALMDPAVKHKLLYAAVSGLALFELIFTFTRGAWLGLALVIVIICWKGEPKYRKKIIVIFIILVLALSPVIIDRFAGLTSDSVEESSLATRLYIWSHMFKAALDNPVLGHGMGSFLNYSVVVLNWRIEAHNEYLKMFFETGIIGLACYLILIAATTAKTIRTKRDPARVVIFALFASFVAMGLADNIADCLVSQWYLWALIGIASSMETVSGTDGKTKEVKC